MAEKEYIEREKALESVREKLLITDALTIASMQHSLESIPAADVRPVKWIPVTERLPETPGEYMVAYHPCYWDRVHDEIKVGLDSFRGKTSWAKKKYQRVTHWMPLPEPPKEE